MHTRTVVSQFLYALGWVGVYMLRRSSHSTLERIEILPKHWGLHASAPGGATPTDSVCGLAKEIATILYGIEFFDSQQNPQQHPREVIINSSLSRIFFFFEEYVIRY